MLNTKTHQAGSGQLPAASLNVLLASESAHLIRGPLVIGGRRGRAGPRLTFQAPVGILLLIEWPRLL